MWGKLGDPLIVILHKALDGSWLRQQAIANNIANIDTPNYKRWDVSFENNLKKALLKESSDLPLVQTNSRHLQGGPCLEEVKPELIQIFESSWRNDGNNVDIEAEMTKQVVNLLNYSLLTRAVTDHFEMLRLAITEGRR